MREIPLTQGQVAIVDDEDYERIAAFKWQAAWNKPHKSFVAQRGERHGKRMVTIVMARFILGVPQTTDVDHWNHDRLDNRRQNLRKCSRSQNGANMVKRSGSTSSIYKGVSWHRATGKWTAMIGVNYHQHYLGVFSCPEDAARAYDAAARKYFGEFARPNFPSEANHP